jgi:hypothetical protein
MLARFLRPARALTRQLGYDLLPLVMFVFPITLPLFWFVVQMAAGGTR